MCVCVYVYVGVCMYVCDYVCGDALFFAYIDISTIFVYDSNLSQSKLKNKKCFSFFLTLLFMRQLNTRNFKHPTTRFISCKVTVLYIDTSNKLIITYEKMQNIENVK